MTIPKYVYAILVGVAVVALLSIPLLGLTFAWVIGSVFPLLVLLMLWDIMSGLSKIWAKLWEISERIETQP